jgi:hypothetical protein
MELQALLDRIHILTKALDDSLFPGINNVNTRCSPAQHGDQDDCTDGALVKLNGLTATAATFRATAAIAAAAKDALQAIFNAFRQFIQIAAFARCTGAPRWRIRAIAPRIFWPRAIALLIAIRTTTWAPRATTATRRIIIPRHRDVFPFQSR